MKETLMWKKQLKSNLLRGFKSCETLFLTSIYFFVNLMLGSVILLITNVYRLKRFSL